MLYNTDAKVPVDLQSADESMSESSDSDNLTVTSETITRKQKVYDPMRSEKITSIKVK